MTVHTDPPAATSRHTSEPGGAEAGDHEQPGRERIGRARTGVECDRAATDTDSVSVTAADHSTQDQSVTPDRQLGEPETKPTVGEVRRARRRAQRAERVDAGVADLRRWLTDQIRHGFVGEHGLVGEQDVSEHRGAESITHMAARMVDAQAPGLAVLLRAAATRRGTTEDWPERLLEDYSMMWLLLGAHDSIGDLPSALAADVRARVGRQPDAPSVLEVARRNGTVVRDLWTVLGVRDRDDERLTVRHIWLRGRNNGRIAVLTSFAAPGQEPTTDLPVGEDIDAEVAFHDTPHPRRAVMGERYTSSSAGAGTPSEEPPGVGVEEAVDAYASALRDEPWLESCPVVLTEAVPVPDALGWRIAGPDGFWLPVDRSRTEDDALWRLAALSGGNGLTVFGEYGARGFAPVTAWHEGRAVPLQTT